MHMHTCRYVFSCVFQRNGDSNRIVMASHRALRLHTVSELRRKKSKGCELKVMYT